MTKQSNSTPAAAPWEPWTGFPATNIMASYTQWLDACGKLQQESLRFVQQRIDKNATLFNTLASCSTPDAALNAQTQFIREAMDDCLAELNRMTKASASVAPQ